MLWMVPASAAGLLAGVALLRRIPTVGESFVHHELTRVSVIIPARDEEENLPALLGSLMNAADRPAEVLVIDDQSADSTAEVAQRFGAQVLRSRPLPPGWTGKNWACFQGAQAAGGDVLCFLDADTSFCADGFGRMMRHFGRLSSVSALSVLPYHATRCWYEELSLFFNIALAMGAGGFGGLDTPHLFGQSLVLRRSLYFAAGGHESVRGQVLENLSLAAAIQAAGGLPVTLGGRGTLRMRMFPAGLQQLRASWSKAFASGARATSPHVLILSLCWFSALAALPLTLLLGTDLRGLAALLYGLAALQVLWYARQLGSFRLLTAVLYPVALVFYFAVFGQSLWTRTRGRPVIWRGRRV